MKPENILVTSKGDLKIIDFGAAVDLCTGINFNPLYGMLDPRYWWVVALYRPWRVSLLIWIQCLACLMRVSAGRIWARALLVCQLLAGCSLASPAEVSSTAAALLFGERCRSCLCCPVL